MNCSPPLFTPPSRATAAMNNIGHTTTPRNSRQHPKQTVPVRMSQLLSFSRANAETASSSIISLPAYPANTQFVGFAVTAAQLKFLLKREQAQRKQTKATIEKRMTEDQRTFVQIEKTLASKIKKDQESLERKLDGYKSVSKKEMRQLLDQTVDLDAKTKESQESRLCAVNANSLLMNKISETMNQISYWNQMNEDIQRRKEGQQGAAAGRTESHAVNDALRVNAEFDDEIKSLRKQLDRLHK